MGQSNHHFNNSDIVVRLIQDAFTRLNAAYGYRQNVVKSKLETLGCKISTPTLSRILSSVEVGMPVLLKVFEGMSSLLQKELGYTYLPNAQVFSQKIPEGWKAEIIPLREKVTTYIPELGQHLNGRLKIEEKARLFASAQKEVYEVGVRLNTFAHYFTSRKHEDFKKHVFDALARGVNIHGYLLDPESNIWNMYFDDRAKILPTEKDAKLETRTSMKILASVMKEVELRKLKGKLSIYTYQHVPYCHFLAIDPHLSHGSILVSPYLYGIPRADCPVFTVYREHHFSTYFNYLDSLTATITDAELIKY